MSKKYRKDQMTLHANLPTFLYKIKITCMFYNIVTVISHCFGKAPINSTQNDSPFGEINSSPKNIQGW